MGNSARDPWFAFAAAVGAYAFAWCVWNLFQGYGNDSDAFRMLDTWQILLSEGRYVGSRFQGSIIPEFLLGFAASIGGPALANLVTLVISIVGIAALCGVARNFGVRGIVLAAAVFSVNAETIIASSTTMDYMIALGIFGAGFYLLTIEQDVGGVLLLGASAGGRITYSVVALMAVLFVLCFRKFAQRREISGLTFASYLIGTFFVSGMFYLPIWIGHNLHFDWLNSWRPTGQGFGGVIARWAYKILMLFSVPGALALGIGALLDMRRRASSHSVPDSVKRRWFLYFCIAVVAFHVILFLYIPAKPAYLLPAMIFGALALQAMDMRFALAGLAIGELISGLVVFDPLVISYASSDPCAGVLATGASISPHVVAGPLIANERERYVRTACNLPILKFQPRNIHDPLPIRAK